MSKKIKQIDQPREEEKFNKIPNTCIINYVHSSIKAIWYLRINFKYLGKKAFISRINESVFIIVQKILQAFHNVYMRTTNILGLSKYPKTAPIGRWYWHANGLWDTLKLGV